MNFAEALLDKLKQDGFTHVFFVAGGNVMHLLNAARTRFECIPVVHEVSAVIAAEYFNETNSKHKSFALVTAGPGLTNAITGIAGAWLESRFVLIIGGQVKSSDLSNCDLRQRGIQEIDGVAITKSITKNSIRLNAVVDVDSLSSLISNGKVGRPGPIFLEICIDTQAAPYVVNNLKEEFGTSDGTHLQVQSEDVGQFDAAVKLLRASSRPVLLIGGGIARELKQVLQEKLEKLVIPTMTTWNGLDRISSSSEVFFGRPNTWGQRYSNVLIQQSDLIIAVGTRLGLQQTGFNWEEFGPLAKVIHVDIDRNELHKGHPRTDLKIEGEAGSWIIGLLEILIEDGFEVDKSWIEFCKMVKGLLPLSESANTSPDYFVNPFNFIVSLSELLEEDEIIIPCSSGGAYTVFMQTFLQKSKQTVISNKGLASMGYGLAGSIGACFGANKSRIILVEGDGGFTQNLQELATVSRQKLPIKIIIFDNGGYASIRMTQKNYFDGSYIGCDLESGLGMPDWKKLFESYGIKSSYLSTNEPITRQLSHFLAEPGPTALLVPIHPEQTYYPKISSRVEPTGNMKSNPLHLMSPDLEEDISNLVFKYI